LFYTRNPPPDGEPKKLFKTSGFGISNHLLKGIFMTVTVYTLPSCVQCDSTKRLLTKNSVAFNEIDLSKDPEAYELVRNLGHSAAPVVVVGEDHWSGFRPDKLQALV